MKPSGSCPRCGATAAALVRSEEVVFGRQITKTLLRRRITTLLQGRAFPESPSRALLVRPLQLFRHGQKKFFKETVFDKARSRQVSHRQVLRQADHEGPVQRDGRREAVPRCRPTQEGEKESEIRSRRPRRSIAASLAGQLLIIVRNYPTGVAAP